MLVRRYDAYHPLVGNQSAAGPTRLAVAWGPTTEDLDVTEPHGRGLAGVRVVDEEEVGPVARGVIGPDGDGVMLPGGRVAIVGYAARRWVAIE